MLSKREEEEKKSIREVVALDELVPDDHLVRKIEQAIDFDFIYDLCQKIIIVLIMVDQVLILLFSLRWS
ncbi:hypothetical protein ACEQPO_19255 [Bacillus sp. SL00103]